MDKLVVNKTATDSLIIKYVGETHQPTFYDKNLVPKEFDYTIESANFKAKPNSTLNGWVLKSKTVAPKATLIYFRGNGSNMLYQFSLIMPYVKKGYQVFIFDYSGFGFSEGKATRKQLLLDGYAAVDYICARKDLADLPIAIFGQSYGGNLAICVAAIKQDKIKAIITEGAFNSHKELAAFGSKAKFMTRLFVAEIYSSEKEVSKITKPLLIIHSQEDKTIPFYMGERIVKNVKADRFEFLKIQGVHLKPNEKDFDLVDKAIMNILK